MSRHRSVLTFLLAAGSACALTTGSVSAMDLLLDPIIDNATPVTRPTTDPGQGEYPTSQSYPDLSLNYGAVPGIMIGQSFVPWGGTFVLNADTAETTPDGRCIVPFRYVTMNEGAAPSNETYNGVYYMYGGYHAELSRTPLPALAAGKGTFVSGRLLLSTGTWPLHVHVDSPRWVSEIDKADNWRAVKIVVQGTCG